MTQSDSNEVSALTGLERDLTLDVGGEGRYLDAWNINPSRFKTLGPERGQPIPRWIAGRIENVPFHDSSVRTVIVERTPLTKAGVRELLRVIQPGGTIVLRHAMAHNRDPHENACFLILAIVSQRQVKLGNQQVCETIFGDVAKQAPCIAARDCRLRV